MLEAAEEEELTEQWWCEYGIYEMEKMMSMGNELNFFSSEWEFMEVINNLCTTPKWRKILNIQENIKDRGDLQDRMLQVDPMDFMVRNKEFDEFVRVAPIFKKGTRDIRDKVANYEMEKAMNKKMKKDNRRANALRNLKNKMGLYGEGEKVNPIIPTDKRILVYEVMNGCKVDKMNFRVTKSNDDLGGVAAIRRKIIKWKNKHEKKYTFDNKYPQPEKSRKRTPREGTPMLVLGEWMNVFCTENEKLEDNTEEDQGEIGNGSFHDFYDKNIMGGSFHDFYMEIEVNKLDLDLKEKNINTEPRMTKDIKWIKKKRKRK
jgi:hypothetical protein